ncbi:hypothetical protein DL766_010237 [Monosporascus sp. MC13-8B]|uniref:DUF7962 domain-containing protein n=1 Tax=Monosporascus cannonballus TaxID=155416 RepID=A0ABY0HAB0_9PEZI|nr:hypothetical protein DL762_004003 [Monosporascus cannonballus]RYO95104.1 hypothetical protein DL763_003802 [Monosporascus cannonballus]RYP02738.1 hypothetical protein DL766_010237 [Monosporascus sp. MC13-8B]
MPRPDLARLGIEYRRIPLLAVGRDVYLDSRLILQKLEELYPPSTAHPSLAAKTGEHAVIERLFSRVTTDGGLFVSGMHLIPADAPVLRDPKFIQDRADMVGLQGSSGKPSPVSPEVLAAMRPQALVEIRDYAELLEATLLADGREWVLNTPGPTLADIEAIWVLHWVVRMPGALPADIVGPRQFPKVFAWIDRFRRALEERKAAFGGGQKSLAGEEAARVILGAQFAEDQEWEVVEDDPVAKVEGLRKGMHVRLRPTDTGVLHKDSGRLVGFTRRETVIETRGADGEVLVRLHAPRHGFKVQRVEDGQSKL